MYELLLLIRKSEEQLAGDVKAGAHTGPSSPFRRTGSCTGGHMRPFG